MIDIGTVDAIKDLEIEYDYTPKASTSYYVGGKEDLGDFYIRLTNEDDTGQIVQWTALGKANLSKGEEITFPKYNADDDRDGDDPSLHLHHGIVDVIKRHHPFPRQTGIVAARAAPSVGSGRDICQCRLPAVLASR